MRFRISQDNIVDGKKTRTYPLIEGEPFVVPGYDEFQFFIRKEGDGISLSEVNTGYLIGWYRDKDEFLPDFKRQLENAGLKLMRQKIAENKMPEPGIWVVVK